MKLFLLLREWPQPKCLMRYCVSTGFKRAPDANPDIGHSHRPATHAHKPVGDEHLIRHWPGAHVADRLQEVKKEGKGLRVLFALGPSPPHPFTSSPQLRPGDPTDQLRLARIAVGAAIHAHQWPLKLKPCLLRQRSRLRIFQAHINEDSLATNATQEFTQQLRGHATLRRSYPGA
jgi:hypothetical protein